MAQEIKMSAAGLKAMQEELEYLKTVRRKELADFEAPKEYRHFEAIYRRQ